MLRLIGLPALIVLLLGPACGGSSSTTEPDVRTIIDGALKQMAGESFSLHIPLCPTCADDQETVIQFAPPDRSLSTGSVGHDDWAYYLMVGSQEFYSSNGKEWRWGHEVGTGAAIYSDPRILLEFIEDPELLDAERIDGKDYFVVRGTLTWADIVTGFFGVTFPSPLPSRPDDLEQFFFQPIPLKFWIQSGTNRVARYEYDSLPAQGSSEDLTLNFDFDTQVSVPEQPPMSEEQAGEIDGIARESLPIIEEALCDYANANKVLPDDVSLYTLSDHLHAERIYNAETTGGEDIDGWPGGWPINVLSGQPMKDVEERSPGNFTYQLDADGGGFGLEIFGWATSVATTGSLLECGGAKWPTYPTVIPTTGR